MLYGFGRPSARRSPVKPPKNGGILAALRRSPLVGTDLNLARSREGGREVDWFARRVDFRSGPFQKKSDFPNFYLPPDPNHFYIHRRLVPDRGALAIVTNVGTGCGGR
jgi:hypothetical protein